MNADPRVMEHFPASLPPAQSDDLAAHEREQIASRGGGLWAVEVTEPVSGVDASESPGSGVGDDIGRFVGSVGLPVRVVRFAFDDLGLRELVSFTFVENRRSRKVMERIGMTHDPAGDFDHPNLPGHPLERHVLYRLLEGL